MTTVWRACPDFPNYIVSDVGDVRNVKTGKTLKPQHPQARAKRSTRGKNHTVVRLYKPGLFYGKDILVHRLVLLAFVGSCPTGMQGCHEDGDPTNNKVGNLRWDTPKGNAADRVRHGTDFRGVKHRCAILNEDDVREIVARRKHGELVRCIADLYGVARTTVSAVVNGASWTHITKTEAAYHNSCI